MAIRMSQIGTKHGHAHGKAVSMLAHPAVELVGVWEPDATARAAEQQRGRYGDVHWAASAEELLGDASITAIAIEGRNNESLAMAQMAVDAGKHIWYDKPAGDDWPGAQRLIATAKQRNLLVQMGYMFRYQPGFQQVAAWARDGMLGKVTSVRAHMSTNIPIRADQAPGAGANTRTEISGHRGGILYDLGGHMLDQIVWLLGRPSRVTAVLRNDATPDVPAFMDNTLAIFEFETGLAFLDISAMEPRPMARRFEVYGTKGSAILEPFDPCRSIRLALEAPTGSYPAGETMITPPTIDRQGMYDGELAAFVAALQGERPADRSLDHELLVQETLLRATGRIA